MSPRTTAHVGARIFDGHRFHTDSALLVAAGGVVGIVPVGEVPEGAEVTDLRGGILAPGFVDLQVNGGGGRMFNDAPDVETLEIMAAAHARLGATTILPTLITDTLAQTHAAVEAVAEAIDRGVPGIAGLHLEGPHLSVARKGAHDPSLIRPMSDDDLTHLQQTAQRLSCLKVTVAPETVTPAQITALTQAGVLVSLGHTDATYSLCREAAKAGARCVTHLFNAMRQLANREPGVVGAALECGDLSAGLIADLNHVHPASIGAALRAKRGPGRVFLVSDAMAPAGSDIEAFTLNGRRISRANGQLTLADGTLAGADLDLSTAVRNLVQAVGIPLEDALSMATSVPATLAGLPAGHLDAGASANMVHLTDDLRLAQVWQGGAPLL